MKTAPFLTILGSLFLTLVSFGVFWTGVTQWAQAVPSLMFFALGYLSVRKTKDIKRTIGCCLFGMLPLGFIMLQFRDMNNSHAIEIAIVGSWVAAAVAGSWMGRKRKGAFARA